ncbi:senescence-associated protein-domain-containing protein, partial [Xylogone sp. PMI_703]
DPKLLYAINGINAYHIENGKEESLTPAGPQTLSLLMVPTSSPFSGVSSTSDSQSQPVEEDFYLHLHLPPELDLPLPATTQIYHQPPTSYLIPRWDLGPDSGAFTRIEFPYLSSGVVSQEDIDTFETILAQCTAFLERAPPPKPARKSSKSKGIPQYNPSEFKPGEGYVAGSSAGAHSGGQIVLIDEENGSVVGELGEGFHVVEDERMKPGSKQPVEITLPQDGSQDIAVAPAPPEYLEMAMHPVYKSSSLVSTAARASRLIVTTSATVSKTLQTHADAYTQKTPAATKPVTFTATTHSRIRKVHTFSEGAAGFSAKTVGQVSKYAQNFGAAMAKKGSAQKAHRGIGPDGKPQEDYKPGLLNKSLMAFSTIADGIDQASRHLLTGTSNAATTVVGHKWGPEAGAISKSIGGGVKNVGLVYIDATGVSRRAIIKSVAK